MGIFSKLFDRDKLELQDEDETEQYDEDKADDDLAQSEEGQGPSPFLVDDSEDEQIK